MKVLEALPGEKLLVLVDAAKIVPRRRRGRPTHASCLRRWAEKGIAGEYLAVLRAGSSLATTERALFEFFAAVTRKKAVTPPVTPGRNPADDAHLDARLRSRGLLDDAKTDKRTDP